MPTFLRRIRHTLRILEMGHLLPEVRVRPLVEKYVHMLCLPYSCAVLATRLFTGRAERGSSHAEASGGPAWEGGERCRVDGQVKARGALEDLVALRVARSRAHEANHQGAVSYWRALERTAMGLLLLAVQLLHISAPCLPRPASASPHFRTSFTFLHNYTFNSPTLNIHPIPYSFIISSPLLSFLSTLNFKSRYVLKCLRPI